jgi:hypothetical protein
MSEAKVGVKPIFALHDAILLVAEGRGPEPARAILHIEMALLFQQVDAAGNQAGVKQGLLGEPDVEMDAELFEVVAAIGQLFRQRMLMHISPVRAKQLLGVGDQCVKMLVALLLGFVVGAAGIRQSRAYWLERLGRAHVLVAMGCRHLLCHVAHIVALVGIGRERNINAVLFEVAQPGRQSEDVHLSAGIIDVILARYVPAGEGQQARQRSAIGSATTMADMQRAGRVGRDEFDLHFLPATEQSNDRSFPPSTSTALEHASVLARCIQGEIDETGASDFGLFDQYRYRQLVQ